MRQTAPPVMYLDLDDTVISWVGGEPKAGPGARDFILWALERYEIRWLTTWCPTGEMEESLLHDLCKMLEIDVEALRHIRGFDWDGLSKLDGIAWLEHTVLRRPFLWVEDDYGFGERELHFMAEHGFLDRYRWCNVTEHPQSLISIHEQLLEVAA